MSQPILPQQPLTDNRTPDSQSHAHPPKMGQKTQKNKIIKEEFKIMYTYIRGMRGKRASLCEIANENNPHLFLLTETQLRSDTTQKIDGYCFHGKAREDGTGGGVAILVRDDIRSNCSIYKSDRNIEIMWCSIRRKNLPPIFVGTYYGKQESYPAADMENEMLLLSEESNE